MIESLLLLLSWSSAAVEVRIEARMVGRRSGFIFFAFTCWLEWRIAKAGLLDEEISLGVKGRADPINN